MHTLSLSLSHSLTHSLTHTHIHWHTITGAALEDFAREAGLLQQMSGVTPQQLALLVERHRCVCMCVCAFMCACVSLGVGACGCGVSEGGYVGALLYVCRWVCRYLLLTVGVFSC